MREQPAFKQRLLPYLLLAPQLLVTIVFFIWPALLALKLSFQTGDAFGIHSKWVWFLNYMQVVTSDTYLHAIGVTLIFSIAVSLLTLFAGLLMAALVGQVKRGSGTYKTLLIWPYAVAPAVAGILWRFIFDPAIGIAPYVLGFFGIHWNYYLNGHQALLLVVFAAAWQQFSYNFLFFVAGMQAIPKSLYEAAALDGAGPFARFRHITLPLVMPTTFFLLVMNMIYSFFDTFGLIQVVTRGGPDSATNILVYKVYHDGFVGLNMGGSSAQSVILMLIVIALTVLQFKVVERKVHY